jgi:hypothetical protein
MFRNTVFSLAVILLMLLIIGVDGQVQTNDYDFWWDLNTGSIPTIGYEVYVWTGVDTTQATINHMAKVYENTQSALTQLFPSGRVHLTDFYPSPLNGEYIKIGVLAYNVKADGSRNYSDPGYSPALLKDLLPPPIPGGCWISK